MSYASNTLVSVEHRLNQMNYRRTNRPASSMRADLLCVAAYVVAIWALIEWITR